MFENPRRGRQARNFTTNVPKILDLRSSSQEIFSDNWRWVPLIWLKAVLKISTSCQPQYADIWHLTPRNSGNPGLRPPHYLELFLDSSEFSFLPSAICCFWTMLRRFCLDISFKSYTVNRRLNKGDVMRDVMWLYVCNRLFVSGDQLSARYYKQGFTFYIFYFLFISIPHFINLVCLIHFSNHSIFSLKLGSCFNVDQGENG